jgi:hypothetical protein
VKTSEAVRENILDQSNETCELLELWTSSNPGAQEHLSPDWGAGMPQTSSVISLIGQNYIQIL